MDVPVSLRGLIAFVDRAMDPRAATRNARHAAAELTEQRRQRDEVERVLRTHVAPTDSTHGSPATGRESTP